MDPLDGVIIDTLVLPALIFCILYALSTFYNRRRTEFSTYPTYVTLARVLTRDPAGIWDAPIALYPQAEIYYSRKDRYANVNDPNASNCTQPDGSARGVRVDLTIMLHHPGVRKDTAHPLLPKDRTTATINDLFTFICDPTTPRSDSFDATKYNVLQVAYSDVLAFIELKPPIPRHCDLADWVRYVALEQDHAQRQAEFQFKCAMRSWRYRHSPSAWLIAGSGDVISLRYVTSASMKDKFNYGQYTRFMDEQLLRRASFTAGESAVTGDGETSRTTFPPFTDAEIYRYTESDPDAYPYLWQRLHSQEEMEALMKRGWTAPMRIGSQVAKVCLEIVRKDIARRAMEEVNSWDTPIDLKSPPSFSPPTASDPGAESAPEVASQPILVPEPAPATASEFGPRFGFAQSDAEIERLNKLLKELNLSDEDQDMELLAAQIDEEEDRASAAASDALTEPDPDADVDTDYDPMAYSGSDVDSTKTPMGPISIYSAT
ncbi:hypothetical protein K525DRAFT_270878 [Schizophyllum commune Loenen D]|nr:hypothetical protein K525DRAFT_270878 [Schizophyllum commune Loenen D]